MTLTNLERNSRMKAKRGLQRRIAIKLGVGEAYISKVVNGRMDGSPRVRLAIARHLNMAVADVFPPINTQHAGA